MTRDSKNSSVNIHENLSFWIPLKKESHSGSFNFNCISVCCRPVPAERKVLKETKKTELDKKELKEKQKWENEYRKRFKVTLLYMLELKIGCLKCASMCFLPDSYRY